MAPIVASDESLVHSVDKGRDKFAFHAKGNPLHACGWNLFPKKRQHFLSMSHYWLKKPPAKKKKTQEIVRFAPIPTDQNRLTVRLRDSLPNFVWSWVIRKRNSKPRAHKLAEVRLSTVWLGWVRDFAFFLLLLSSNDCKRVGSVCFLITESKRLGPQRSQTRGVGA